MVSSSKILTVSYGTFSCTAEGFEDPLAVMKDTTHFFRSVVGEDRFFGAEPPQFDPELASELMREQLASHQGGQVRLDLPGASHGNATAASSGALAAALAAGPTRAKAEQHALPDDDTIEATAYEPEPEMDATETDDAPATSELNAVSDTIAKTDDLDLDALLVEDADQAADLAEPVGNAPAPRPTGAASVAAKLDRIRAVVADTEAENAAHDAPIDAADKGDDALNALLANAAIQADTAADAAADDIEPILDETGDVTDDNLFTDTIAGLMQADVADIEPSQGNAPEQTPEQTPDIEQVLETAFDEDEGEFDLVAALDQVDKAEIADSPVADEDPLAAWDRETDQEELDGEDTDQTQNDMLGGDIAAAVAGLTETAFDDEEDDALFVDEPVDALMASSTVEPASEPEPLVDAAPEPALEPAPEPTPAPRRVRARVVKVKRSDFDRAVQSGQLEEVVEDTPAAPIPPAAAEDTPPPAPMASSSSLSDEEEDELARELAAVKAELAGEMAGWDDVEENAQKDAEAPVAATATEVDDWGWDEEEDDVAALADDAPLRLDNPVAPPEPEVDLSAAIDGARKAVKMASPARAMLTEQSVEDNDTSRILDQTNTELEEPEGNRRRSAIAHLRAAVAATKADRLLGRKPTAEEETEPYREDLATVVRPRRPQSGGARTERPSVEPQRSAPLKLVAEQRVEESGEPTIAPAQAQVAPVRPRRVRRAATAATASPQRSERPQENAAPAPLTQPTGDGDFAAYAESVGAQDLPDLLEAAAAYMSYVEGLDQFSRPQLMTTVRQAEARESSREDRLRSFGQLLRDGKIEKTSGGRFTASDRISFKPSRAVG